MRVFVPSQGAEELEDTAGGGDRSARVVDAKTLIGPTLFRNHYTAITRNVFRVL